MRLPSALLFAAVASTTASCSSNVTGDANADDHDSGGDTRHDDGGDSGDSTNSGDGDADSGDHDGPATEIGVWSDAPGACPTGSIRADITTVAQMQAASRGEASVDADCFFVHDGTYTQSGSTIPLYFLRAGTASKPITWVGESRAGVVIRGRAGFEKDVSAWTTLANMTFDIHGLAKETAYNTITVMGEHITISHVSLTGDCETGAQGGHIEVDDGVGNTLIESCLIENFGRCDPENEDGHLDHGIYIASTHDLVIRNNVIRGNASRGIQLNTEQGEFGTIDGVVIENNRIYLNGHRPYEDGIVMNGENGDNPGSITNVAIRHNLIHDNYYAGIRFVGGAVASVTVTANTFYENGTSTSGAARSEVNLDGGTPAAVFSKNIIVPQRTTINACAVGLSITDNVIFGDAAGDCIANTRAVDPAFVDAANTDRGAASFRTQNADLASYGAYAP